MGAEKEIPDSIDDVSHRLSRRRLLGTAAAGTAMALLPATAGAAAPGTTRSPRRSGGRLFRELDERIEAGMRKLAIPGVALGVIHEGREHLRGYGVTNVDYPVAVDPDTVFRAGSTTKTFTGTAIMRLVEMGKVKLDAPVRTYLPGFAVADRRTSRAVTVRQLLNHTSGFLGDDYQDFGAGDDAIGRYVDSMARLPQLTPVGTTFSYNDAGLVVTGRVIEAVTGSPYEAAIDELLLEPLGLEHTTFFSEDIVGFNVAASHKVVGGKAVPEPAFWRLPRSINPTGGLISSVRDQLRWARFHLGDGRAPGGRRLLSPSALRAMRSRPGPGGTLLVELEGMGVTWMLRPSAEGVRIVQHGGNWAGQLSGFVMVPSRGFAMTLMTNSTGGDALTNSLFADDWALREFAGVSNPPATAQTRSAAELRPYEGRWTASYIGVEGKSAPFDVELRARGGRLAVEGALSAAGFDFYGDDLLIDLDADGKPLGSRSDFLRDSSGRLVFLRSHGRLFKR